VWLPPVANDTTHHAFDIPIEDGHLLATQFASRDGLHVLRAYLQEKLRWCELISQVREDEGLLDFSDANDSMERIENIFVRHRNAAFEMLGLDPIADAHADGSVQLPHDLTSLGKLLGDSWAWRYYWGRDIEDIPALVDYLEHRHPGRGRDATRSHNLGAIRKAAASDAINAIWLRRVVNALRARRIRMCCQTVADGAPRQFGWSAANHRFEAQRHLASTGLRLTLLGPSNGLVKKHWNRLPVGDYLAFALLADIPLRQITPSNELSYVMRLEFQDQGLLVAGDASCVDFKRGGSKQYHQALLDALLPLQVVQVAHHAGYNSHFYRALLSAGYAQQPTASYLLVSHAYLDKKRPTNEFRLFIENLRHEPDTIKIVFTSQPRIEKVQDYVDLIQAPIDQRKDVGDVRLQFADHAWNVVKHAVNPL
jgi:hypothetical protein